MRTSFVHFLPILCWAAVASSCGLGSAEIGDKAVKGDTTSAGDTAGATGDSGAGDTADAGDMSGGDPTQAGDSAVPGDTGASVLGDPYWVNKGGDDSHGCSNSTSDACLTIQRGISVLQPGDVLNIGQGTYTDDGGTSPYLTPDTPHSMGSTPTRTSSFNIVFDRSGTPTMPITIRADPANTSAVIVDGEHILDGKQTDRGGIFMNYKDYIRIEGLTLRNFLAKGIANWDHTGEVPSDSNLSIGVVVEDCTIHHVGGGDNDAAIAMWSTKDWVVRNNHIYDIYGIPSIDRGAQGIQSYGTINALVEYNLIEGANNGIFWKDHYVVDESTREPVFESEIRYNLIRGKTNGILVSIQGSGTVEAGENYIHHNVFVGLTRAGSGGITYGMAGAGNPTVAPQRIEHNLFIGSNASDSSALVFGGTTDVHLRGNIFHGFTRAITTRYVSSSRPVGLDASDYNIYGDSDLDAAVLLDRYSTGAGLTARGYATLSDWQAATQVSGDSLGVDGPDANSVEADVGAVIEDHPAGNYHYPTGSPALGMMPDGSNAGPFQLGSEVIGPLP